MLSLLWRGRLEEDSSRSKKSRRREATFSVRCVLHRHEEANGLRLIPKARLNLDAKNFPQIRFTAIVSIQMNERRIQPSNGPTAIVQKRQQAVVPRFIADYMGMGSRDAVEMNPNSFNPGVGIHAQANFERFGIPGVRWKMRNAPIPLADAVISDSANRRSDRAAPPRSSSCRDLAA